MQYKVSAGKEFFTLAKVYKAGETVELPEHEGAPFVGGVFEAPEPIEIEAEVTPVPPAAETEFTPKHKRSK